MTFIGNTLADMNLLEESPGCYGFSWRFTGLEWTQVKVHRAVMDLIKVHRAVMDLIVESPGCSGFTPFFFRYLKKITSFQKRSGGSVGSVASKFRYLKNFVISKTVCRVCRSNFFDISKELRHFKNGLAGLSGLSFIVNFLSISQKNYVIS